MKSTLMALAAGACALLLAGPAAAHVEVRVHAQVPGYYYPPAAMHPRYAPPPFYIVGDPYWQARRDMEWRRDYWQREHWRHRHYYHHHHHHHHHRHHRHHHRHGWDGWDGRR